MATIRSYTTIEQSRVLAGFLPPKSADMEYLAIKENGALVGTVPFVKDDSEVEDSAYNHTYDRIACWSLAALLCILKDYTLQTNTDGTVFVVCEGKKPIISDFYNNPVDACVDAIENLHKLSLL